MESVIGADLSDLGSNPAIYYVRKLKLKSTTSLDGKEIRFAPIFIIRSSGLSGSVTFFPTDQVLNDKNNK